MEPAIGAAIKLAAEVAELAVDVQEEKNAPDVKAAKKAQNEVTAVDREIKAVAEQDAATLRKNLAE
jgi:hypothetical protein